MKTKKEILDWAKRQPTLGDEEIKEMRIAVAALIFNQDGEKILLNCRGPYATDALGCLEGIGGSLDASDEDMLERALMRELTEEITSTCDFSIDEFLVCSHLRFRNHKNELKDWAVASFLCHLVSGEPGVGEPGNMTGIGWFDITDLASWEPDQRRKVSLVDYDGNPFEVEAGLSIWVPTVIYEYKNKYGINPWFPALEKHE